MLDTAVNGRAAPVVTGDEHLLAFEDFEGVRIVTVAAALKILPANKESKRHTNRVCSPSTAKGSTCE